jgi:hypothetical protein
MTHAHTKRARGRPFELGNKGRPRGAKNRKNQILETLSSEDQESLVRRAFDLAMEGEPQLLRFFLGRIMPKDRLIEIEQPPSLGQLVNDASDVIAMALRDVCNGKITPAEGAAVAATANQHTHAVEVADINKRLDLIEAKTPNGQV